MSKQMSPCDYLQHRETAISVLIVAMKIICGRKCRCVTLRPIDFHTVTRCTSRGVPGSRLLLAAMNDYRILTTGGCPENEIVDRFSGVTVHARRAIVIYAESGSSDACIDRVHQVLSQSEATIERIERDLQKRRCRSSQSNSERNSMDRAETRGF